MAEIRPVPIGVENFKEIIDKNCYFTDKSLLIREVEGYAYSIDGKKGGFLQPD